jgi:hypothetical protein
LQLVANGTAASLAARGDLVSAGGSAGSTAAGAGSTPGVQIDVQQQPQPGQTGVVAVSVPPETATAGAGFSFVLPAELVMQLNSQVTVSLEDGSPLPAWLRFDPVTGEFRATAVPDRAFPVRVRLDWSGQQLLVVISERTT